MGKITARELVAFLIIAGFFTAYFIDPSDQIFKGAIVAAFASACGYYLGSSKGAQENRDALNKLHDKGPAS